MKKTKKLHVISRNPFVAHLINRPSGPQQKPYKSKRKQEKQKGYKQDE